MTKYHHETNTGEELITDSPVAPTFKKCGKRYSKTRVATKDECIVSEEEI